jgi:hypothetical protein
MLWLPLGLLDIQNYEGKLRFLENLAWQYFATNDLNFLCVTLTKSLYLNYLCKGFNAEHKKILSSKKDKII